MEKAFNPSERRGPDGKWIRGLSDEKLQHERTMTSQGKMTPARIAYTQALAQEIKRRSNARPRIGMSGIGDVAVRRQEQSIREIQAQRAGKRARPARTRDTF